MPTDKFIFKVYRNGHVERVKDCNNITFSDVIHGLGISKKDLKYKPIKNSGIYAFYGDDKCDILIFAVPEHKPDKKRRSLEKDTVHGIQDCQFRMLSTPETTLF